MKLVSNLMALAAIIVPTFASAQFVKDDGTTRVQAVSMSITQVSPGVADLTWYNAGVNFLNAKVLPEGITAVRDEADTAGKGTARNVNYASHPAIFAGYRHCVTVAGPVNYAGGKENVPWDLTKLACAAQATSTVTVRVQFRDFGQNYGIVPALVKANGQFVGWAWHGMNVQRLIARPGTTNPDVVTLLRVDTNGTVRLANDAEFEAYKVDYAKMF